MIELAVRCAAKRPINTSVKRRTRGREARLSKTASVAMPNLDKNQMRVFGLRRQQVPTRAVVSWAERWSKSADQPIVEPGCSIWGAWPHCEMTGTVLCGSSFAAVAAAFGSTIDRRGR